MSKPFVLLAITAVFGMLLSACTPTGVTIETETPTVFHTETPKPTLSPSDSPKPTESLPAEPEASLTIRVPEDQPTIQAGVDAAPDGGLILVAPGTYTENIRIARKSVTLASHFHTTGDEQFIENTIIDGADRIAIIVAERAGPDTKIIGFTIQNGDEGISARGTVEILNNRFVNNRDGVGYQNGAGLNRGNVYENNRDDGIDLDRSSQAIIEDNIIRNNRNDGIEVRLHEYSGPMLNIIIRIFRR